MKTKSLFSDRSVIISTFSNYPSRSNLQTLHTGTVLEYLMLCPPPLPRRRLSYPACHAWTNSAPGNESVFIRRHYISAHGRPEADDRLIGGCFDSVGGAIPRGYLLHDPPIRSDHNRCSENTRCGGCFWSEDGMKSG